MVTDLSHIRVGPICSAVTEADSIGKLCAASRCERLGVSEVVELKVEYGPLPNPGDAWEKLEHECRMRI
jgi:hypothetical protein